MKKISFLILLLGCAGQAFAQWPRFFWEQIEESDSTYSLAITDANNNGRWTDSLRWLPIGPYLTINGDTVATLDDVTGITSFEVNPDVGANQTITDGDILTLAGGAGIGTQSFTADQIDFVLDISEFSFASADSTTDFLVFYDVSEGIHRKILIEDLPIVSGGGTDLTTSGPYTQGSVIFAGASGELTENNTDFNWDNTNNILTLQNAAVFGQQMVFENSAGTELAQLVLGADGAARNMGLGRDAMNSITTGGKHNIAFGNESLRQITTAIGNIAIGRETGEALVSEDYNIFIGYRAGRLSSGGSGNLAIGERAGERVSGSNNIMLGEASMASGGGSNNIAIGQSAATAMSSGNNNTFIGGLIGPSLTSSSSTILIGYRAGNALSTPTGLTIMGNAAGLNLTTSDETTIVGAIAGQSVTSTTGSTYVGYNAQGGSVGADNITSIGRDAGANNTGTTGGSIFLGAQAGPSATDASDNVLYIANAAGAPTIYGDLANKYIGIGQESADYELDLGTRTGAIHLPTGTTAQRPIGAAGVFRYNSDNTEPEYYDGSAWVGVYSDANNIYNNNGTIASFRTVDASAGMFWDLRTANTQFEVTGDSIDWLLNTRDGIIISDLGAAYYNVDMSEAGSSAFIQVSDGGTYDNTLDIDSSMIRLYSRGAQFALNNDTTNVFTDERGVGIVYAADYSGGFTARSLVDKDYVDNNALGGTVGDNELAYGSSGVLASSDKLTVTTTGAFYGVAINDHSKVGTKYKAFSNNDGVANIIESYRGRDADNDNADFYYDQLQADANLFAIWTTIPVKDSANMKGGATEIENIKPFIVSADETHSASTFGTRIDMYVREKNNTSSDTKVFTADSDGDITFPANDVYVTAGQFVPYNVATASLPTGITGGNVFDTTKDKPGWYDSGGIWQYPAWESETDYGVTTGSTDASGDLTVNHQLNSASIYVAALPVGTTFYNLSVHTKTSTTFKIRFFDAAGSAVTSTSVTVDWIAKL